METRLVPDAPGAWLVYDLGTLVFAVPQEQRATADAVAARRPTALADVLATLTTPRAATPFAVLELAGEGLRVALRGVATLAAGTETLTGLGAEPWLERVIPGVALVRLTVPGGEWTLTLTPPTVARSADVRQVAEVPALEVRVPPGPKLPEPSAPVLAVPVAPPALGLGEHDGHTVLASALQLPEGDGTVVVDEVARLRAKRSAGTATVQVPPPALPPPGPRLNLELPDGSREPLDAVVLIGRAPTAPVHSLATRLVRLDGDGDISRNHASVAVEGDTVVVTDLGSRNGTIVRIPGRPAQKLRTGEPTPVLVGTVIDLGGGFELTVRED